MSVRNISCGVKVAGTCGWLYQLHVLIVLKYGSLNILEPTGPVLTCTEIASPIFNTSIITLTNYELRNVRKVLQDCDVTQAFYCLMPWRSIAIAVYCEVKPRNKTIATTALCHTPTISRQQRLDEAHPNYSYSYHTTNKGQKLKTPHIQSNLLKTSWKGLCVVISECCYDQGV